MVTGGNGQRIGDWLFGGIPNHFVGVENLGLGGGAEGLGVTVAEGDDTDPVVTGDETFVPDFGLTQ